MIKNSLCLRHDVASNAIKQERKFISITFNSVKYHVCKAEKKRKAMTRILCKKSKAFEKKRREKLIDEKL